MKFSAAFTALALAATTVSAAPVAEEGNHLAKRFSGTATFFTPGLGSCGGTDDESSMIVAMNQDQGGDHCGQSVQITNQETGQSTTAKVTDLCPSCSQGDLDMSPAVFKALGGTNEQGVFPIQWNFA